MPRHVNDDLLKAAVQSYLNQIGGQFKTEGASDCGVIVIIARPDGAGEFKAFGAGVIDGHQMDGATQRKILKAVHNSTGVLATSMPKAC